MAFTALSQGSPESETAQYVGIAAASEAVLYLTCFAPGLHSGVMYPAAALLVRLFKLPLDFSWNQLRSWVLIRLSSHTHESQLVHSLGSPHLAPSARSTCTFHG